MELMRRESFETTLKFYVGQDTERTADGLWEAVETMKSNNLGKIGQNGAKSQNEESLQNHGYEGTF